MAAWQSNLIAIRAQSALLTRDLEQQQMIILTAEGAITRKKTEADAATSRASEVQERIALLTAFVADTQNRVEMITNQKIALKSSLSEVMADRVAVETRLKAATQANETELKSLRQETENLASTQQDMSDVLVKV